MGDCSDSLKPPREVGVGLQGALPVGSVPLLGPQANTGHPSEPLRLQSLSALL